MPRIGIDLYSDVRPQVGSDLCACVNALRTKVYV